MVSNLSCVRLSVAYVLVNWAVNTGDTHSVRMHGTNKLPPREDNIPFQSWLYLHSGTSELFNKLFVASAGTNDSLTLELYTEKVFTLMYSRCVIDMCIYLVISFCSNHFLRLSPSPTK